MIWVDWAILAILLLSAFFGGMRGMVRELISLSSWIAAILIAYAFGPKVSELFIGYIDNETIRSGVGFALTAIIVVIIGSLLAKVAGTLVSATGLSGFDRILGFIFGVVRGIAILIVLTAIVSLLPVNESGWWSESQFIPLLEDLRDQAAGLVDSFIR
ncbi:CvpA family protein [Oceanospirillum maris]|jgi:membrane protein required for colicin V production|uniref:CvpA family protein n=1 Tax=Oceanospirillum maris TaxID=64977 RepID=UPI0003F651A5|nr:CvpA family protein [Oceanospirillum maris]